MATELFKETMQELKDDYIEYAKTLNGLEGINPLSLKLTLVDYTQFYMDFLAIQMQEQPLDDYPEDELDLEDKKEEPQDEETY